MARYYYIDDGGNRMYVKTVDTKNNELTFTTNRSEAYTRSGWYYETAEVDFLRFHFKKKYPQMERVKMDS